MRTLKLELGPRVRIDFPFLPSAPDPTKSKKRDESLTRKPPSDTADSPKQKRPMAPVAHVAEDGFVRHQWKERPLVL